MIDATKLKLSGVAWDPDERYVDYDGKFIGAVRPLDGGTGYEVLAPGNKPGGPFIRISHARSHQDGAEQLARHHLNR